ncbi:MAG: hypothetical protein K5923_01805 [Clostridia bacterium]|nr:hypothetical protein [Clostridia bacterium]
MTFEELDNVRFKKYGAFSEKAIRVVRAISWGKAAEKTEIEDEQFIFYWISLNAAYSDDMIAVETERLKRKVFFDKISELDKENRIKKALMSIPNQLRIFVDSKYLYDEYWRAQKGDVKEEDFEKYKSKVMQKIYSGLMAREDEIEVLDYLFSLMAVLRNQIFHGLATYQSKANREQLKSGVKILKAIIPIIIEIVLINDDVDWGAISYPLINK